MELRHIRYFVAVGKCLSFTKAAEMLHVSQPPLSRQIQEFEEEIGTALFDRSGKKTSLTEAGSYLLVEAERLLEGIESACRNAKAISEKSRSLSVGCVNFFFNTNLMPFLEETRRAKPDLRMELRVMSTEAQERALASGAIDVGFVRSWIREESLKFEPVAEEALALIFPKGIEMPGASPEELVSKLACKPFIGMSRSGAAGLTEAVYLACSKLGYTPSPAYECIDAFSIIGLVSSGLGWSIIPSVDLGDSQLAGIGTMGLPDKVSIGICYRIAGLSADAREFIDLARDFFLHRDSRKEVSE
jgi:LysR family transcriptional regulator, benzoate and cis,cis-muconate-responsive activator of ben and cat genes